MNIYTYLGGVLCWASYEDGGFDVVESEKGREWADNNENQILANLAWELQSGQDAADIDAHRGAEL